ncbi:MAG: NlpC/P60 family protein [Bacillota bacterium]|nr:NlpC/P60 family protein [Bacillota bacterium]
MKKQLMTIAATAGILLTAFGGSASAHGTTYTVRSGDCLSKIAKVNHLSVKQLKQWNHLTSNVIKVNQKLVMVAPKAQVVTKSRNMSTHTLSQTYTVKLHDTLSGIAKKFSTTVSTLKSLNHLHSDIIKIGQKLSVNGRPTSVIVTPVAAPVNKINAVEVDAPISKIQEVISIAKKYMGTPYVWGGESPSGFDCSGYVSYVFSKIGVSLPRTAAAQWSELKSVGFPNPGDLIFFETYKKGPSHVGIFLGGNQFIHASSHGVVMDDMTSLYWRTKYLGARSIF